MENFKGLIAIAIICFLMGFMIGSAVGAYQSLNWVVHKAEYFIERDNNSFNINFDELTRNLIRYKIKIDSEYP